MTETVGSALRQIRKGRGESIVEVAKATHTSPASFTKWENDQTIPSERSIRKLAEYYNTDANNILALAYPDKYATNRDAIDLDEYNVIRVEDLLADNTILTYNGSRLPQTKKDLVASFTAGMIIGSAAEQD
ncbi:helix-turn-helix domain-containing protein [Lacticaseibacillus camelliae]|uniref:XRE family transcriptional regulator n=1 Tax=Lacticaseibacillus camelliae DSM 22697 = JCM 13995 TaxID=1423730 RepID=A0A0R2FDY2_9LACO|nr:helix-turn-helix transcriptional regulator [Lacticaseibacillus camelliae]KRN23354.1 XRE family transcriptional regulator [Lacticaseibacillus camelliae DSM 22697 = JCM 13995]